jgi:hypothetical protein
MTTSDTDAMQALQELLAERQRYEGWMKALEERQASTPPQVFTRVHTDYSLRLDRVMQRLAERTEHVRTTVESMGIRLAGLRSKEAERIEARQEAELRALVGEYTDEEWGKIRDEADLEIELMAEERRGVESELAEMERILELTKPAKAEPAVEAVVQESVTEPESVAGSAEASAATTASQPTPQPTPRPAVFPQATTSAPANATATATSGTATSGTVASSSSSEGTPSIDDFIADWPVRQVGSAAQAQGDGVAEVPEVDEAPKAASNSQSRAAGFATPAATQNALTPAVEPRREQEKTLKCPECGAMNYATEWYCERCGGELATF